MPLRLPIALCLAVVTSGCLGKFNTPSAYHEQTYLCDPAHAAQFQAIVDGCKVDGGCAGAFSMRGTLQGQPLTVETSLSDVGLGVVQRPGDTVVKLDRVNLTGASPYFQFVFHLKSVGGEVTAAGDATPRTLQLNASASGLPDPLDDDQVNVGQFLEAGGASVDQQGLSSSGQLVISFQSLEEVKGAFHGEFGEATDSVDGCFDALAVETTTNPAPTP